VRVSVGLCEPGADETLGDRVPRINHQRRIQNVRVAPDRDAAVAGEIDEDGRRRPEELRVLVQQRAFASHLDAAGAACVEFEPLVTAQRRNEPSPLQPGDLAT